MKFVQLTLYINADEANSIITFIEELKRVLVDNYGDEIRESRRASLVIAEPSEGAVDDIF